MGFDLDDEELKSTRKLNGTDKEKKYTDEEIEEFKKKTGIDIDKIYFE